MVFYLKYRPQKIADLDLPEIREGLLKLISAGKVPHALLFSGPRGSGKTSAARIIAKAVNCLKSKGRGEPCNRCSVCRGIAVGSFIDLLEIDGASNRGIDDIRTLRENIKLSPAQGRFKVYIIDEVHMLTPPAFNALLKTLEEPPRHALFVLCTTQPEKLPETIISRCTHFRFRKAKPKEVELSLAKVVKSEKLVIEKGVLELIARKVDGSFRDAKKVLDQLAAGGKKISLVEAQKLMGEIESLSPLRLLKALSKRDVREGLLEVNRLVEAGADLKVYLSNFLEASRLVLMGRLGVEEFEEEKETKKLTADEVRDLIRKFSQAVIELKGTVIPQLPLELAVIEWCQERGGRPEPKKVSEKNQLVVNQVKEKAAGGQLKLKRVQEYWPEVLLRVRPMNHSVEALLRSCRPHQVDGEVLTLEVFYRFHKERLETEKCRLVVEEAVGGVLGSPVKIRCVLGEKKNTEEIAPDLLSTAEEIFNGKVVG